MCLLQLWWITFNYNNLPSVLHFWVFCLSLTVLCFFSTLFSHQSKTKSIRKFKIPNLFILLIHWSSLRGVHLHYMRSIQRLFSPEENGNPRHRQFFTRWHWTLTSHCFWDVITSPFNRCCLKGTRRLRCLLKYSVSVAEPGMGLKHQFPGQYALPDGVEC